MSHLSKIKTRITNYETLVKVLDKLQIDHTICSKGKYCKPSFSLQEKAGSTPNNSSTIFVWDGTSYQIIADSSDWEGKHMLEAMVDKVYQTYAYQTVLDEGHKQGFKSVGNYSNNDGSLRIVLERWSN
uniref:Uncharacterized protein ycf35 n=1 Tax=Nemalion sp. H.1444 TaxID=1907586 RepID=A0A1G4NW51_9FLOR|nr:Hypothetical protein ycf35 [Nemalion sp. H.1444]